MLSIYLNPLNALKAAKKQKSVTQPMLQLLAATLLIAIAVLIQGVPLRSALVALAVVYVTVVLIAAVLDVALLLLGKKAGFGKALTVMNLEASMIAAGYLLISLVMKLPMTHNATVPFIISLIAIVSAISLVAGKILALRATMELYKMDMISAAIVLCIVCSVLLVVGYLTLGTVYAMSPYIGMMGMM
ncbi:hypothetical protein AUJ68_01995 [Candidatus Woesearchaeota archaeon CG1_02_57_44]|nr:MAG: hypothetical protein AUJ68_01995 [Candidatus Woesearchaeota archaeon CG1_02_57_44]PIN67911.1 MAG: hypothetical protein COV94_06515 [Candidatus Woesearchaeota archaeon CG11_big_fil_rev_8_21_14_0_20_57_5]